MKSLLVATALLFASAAPALAEIAVTAADNGGTVQIASGDTLTLSLPTRGGVPYAWTILSEIEPQISPVDQKTVAATPGMPGGAANLIFTFVAGEPGTVTLTAALMPFTGGGAPAQTVSMTVTVTP